MNRRLLLKHSLAGASGFLFPQLASAQATNPVLVRREGWTNYQITTYVTFSSASKETGGKEVPANLWLPLPSTATDYQRFNPPRVNAEGAFATEKEDPRYGAKFIHIQSPGGKKLELTLQSTCRTTARTVNFNQPKISSILPEDANLYTRSTQLMPTNGIVLETAKAIVGNRLRAYERANLIYRWVVERARFNDQYPGQGSGDVQSMFLENDFSGGSLDITSLFVALTRALDIPARIVSGLYVAPTKTEFKSLGLNQSDATRGQHVRAEFFDQQLGWVPVDPAAVARAMFYDSANKTIMDKKITALSEQLFGSWEMNWIALNHAQELPLPNSRFGVLPAFMFPAAETRERVFDSNNPVTFQYRIEAQEVKI